MDHRSGDHALTRRQLLALGAGAAAAAPFITVTDLAAPGPAAAQTPKRGGGFRIPAILDPVGFDPHQTISFTTMTQPSFAHSRLLKVKAGPSVRPGTYPLEPDLAESWTQPNERTYVFKVRKGVRWHPKSPVNGRELTADDVKYTYDRFLATKTNGNRATLEARNEYGAYLRYPAPCRPPRVLPLRLVGQGGVGAKNWGPSNGFDQGGRMMAAWLDK